MKSDRDCLDSLINNLEESKRYLNSQLEFQSIYVNAIALLESKINFLNYQTKEISKARLRQQQQDLIEEINAFFATERKKEREKIQKLRQEILQAKTIHSYKQQVLNKTFNQINQQLQRKTLYLKQKINQSRSIYLNIFMSDSWLFQLQQIIDSSEVEVVREKKNTYIYCTIDRGETWEYLHHYIINLYQQQITESLNSQWSKIDYLYADGGFDAFTLEAKEQLLKIKLLNTRDLEALTLESNLVPQLSLSEIIDPNCLKINSRIIFDYNYLQSSWFKLLVSLLVGITIYSITKLYFGTGKYIGFFILIFQIINISTGQTAKSLKLKQHKKELKRTVSSKYQILLRAIVERMTNTLIVNIDRTNQKYQQQLETISELAHIRLEAIESELDRAKERKESLERDKLKLQSWLNSK